MIRILRKIRLYNRKDYLKWKRQKEAEIYEWKIQCLMAEGLTRKEAIGTLEMGL